MRLPAYLLGLLSVSPLTPLMLTGCADADPAPETAEEPVALRSQVEEGDMPVVAASDAGSAPVVAAPLVTAPDSGAVEVPNVSPPTNDPCPGCGLG
jgi:hypothetical protein